MVKMVKKNLLDCWKQKFGAKHIFNPSYNVMEKRLRQFFHAVVAISWNFSKHFKKINKLILIFM